MNHRKPNELMINIFSILSLLTLVACTFNQVPVKILSNPDYRPTEIKEPVTQITIASTQNFHGALDSQSIPFPLGKGKTNTQLHAGGIDYFSSYVKVMRKLYGENLILLDTGHIFDPNSPEKIPQVIQAYKKLGYDGINLTDRELKLFSQINYEGEDLPFLSSNIVDLKTLKPTDQFGTLPYKIATIKEIKVGIISLTTFKAVTGKQEKYKRGLYFEDPVLSFLKTKKMLNKSKVELVILMVSSESLDDIHHLVKRLPPNSVDLIVSGNTYSSAREIEEIPLLQNPGKGQFFSSIELFYDRENRTVLKDKTVNYGPTKICSHFFRSTMDCHYDDGSEHRQKRLEIISDSKFETIPAKFLGHEIHSDNDFGFLTNK